MKRPKNDPRVAEVMAALERVMRSPARDGAITDLAMVSMICTRPGSFEGWPDAGVRAVLLAYAQHCPDGHLEELVQAARNEVVEIERYECERAADPRLRALAVIERLGERDPAALEAWIAEAEHMAARRSRRTGQPPTPQEIN